jgi:hypothetical protein
MLALSTIGDRFSPERAAGINLAIILGTLYLARAMKVLRVQVPIQRAVILIEMLGLIALAWRLIAFSGPQGAGWRWLRAPFEHLTDLADFIPGALALALVVIWLCWRGLRLSTQPLDVMSAVLRFQIGIVTLALFVTVVTLTTGRDITIFVPPFFFSQLLAIGLIRVETIWQERGGRHSPFSGWWLAVLVGSTGIVTVLAGVISAGVLGIGPEKILLWLQPFLVIITLPIALLLLPIVALVGIIIEALMRYIVLRWPTIAQELPIGAPSTDSATQLPPLVQTALRLAGYGKGTLTILLVLAALVGVAWIVGRWRASQEGQEGEKHESIWSSRALLRKLYSQWQRRLSRLENLANIAGRFGADGLFTALTIRRIYAQTVKLAASHGYPRSAARTPYEHLLTLQQAFSGCEGELAQITEAYVGVHYGELPERPDALAEIRAAFERVKTRATETRNR